MTPDFLAFLQSEEARSYDTTLLSEVETALNSYNGAPYGDEEDGRSQVVARDVSETVDYMLTSLLDVMDSSGRVVEFEPTDGSEEDQADDATEAMHYLYRRKSGYRLIHDWAKAGLLEKIGIVKSCVERKRSRVERVLPAALLPGETEEELRAAGIVSADDAGEDPELGALVKVASIEEGAPEFPDYFVPLEEFRFSPEARDFDSAVYLAHIVKKTISELVEEGFDLDTLLTASSDGGNPTHDTTALARDQGRQTVIDSARSGVLREVWLREEYVLFDLNGDGIAERLCVHRIGNTVLVRDGETAVKEVDYQPFEFWCPFPMAGRIVGQSLADKVMDIQRVNTVLERNMLDSLYSQQAPGTLIHEDSVGDHTIDDLLTIRPRRIVRWRGAVAPIPEQVADTSSFAMQAIEFKIRQRESRTGITRLNKGVDEDTLNDTASGQKMLMARGQQMEKYVIRNFAEGVARLFMKKIGLMRRFAQPFQIRVDGEYRQVDPSQWPESMEVNVKVGLGSGSKDERIAYRNMIAQAHFALKQGGSPIVTDENIFNNMTGFCKDAGLSPNDLFTAVPKGPDGQPIPQQQAPDPRMIEAQAKMQLEQMKAQHKQQLDQIESERKRAEAQAKIELEQFKTVSKAELDRSRAQAEADLANVRLAFEQRMALVEAQHRREIEQFKASEDARVKRFREGGRLDK